MNINKIYKLSNKFYKIIKFANDKLNSLDEVKKLANDLYLKICDTQREYRHKSYFPVIKPQINDIRSALVGISKKIQDIYGFDKIEKEDIEVLIVEIKEIIKKEFVAASVQLQKDIESLNSLGETNPDWIQKIINDSNEFIIKINEILKLQLFEQKEQNWRSTEVTPEDYYAS